MNDDLEGKIAKWLKTQGYPLEMKVAAALRKEGFFVNQGSYYLDPETNTSREIDVIATKNHTLGIFDVSFVIECKSSLDKPWVLFTSENHEEGKNIFLTFAMLSDLARKKLSSKLFTAYTDKSKEAEKDSILSLRWLKKPMRTAYGIAASLTSGSGGDPAYSAIMGALKASIDLSRLQEDRNAYHLGFVFPVVVLEGRLFEAFLESSDNTVVHSVDAGFVTYYRTIAGFPCCSVHVITADHLSAFCTEAMAAVNQIEALLQVEIEEMQSNLLKTSGSGNQS